MSREGEGFFDGGDGGCRIEGHARAAAAVLDLLEDPVEVGASFGVDGDMVDASVDEIWDASFGFHYHQVGVQG